MLGYSEMKEVAIWVQTNQEAEVFIEYWISGHPDTAWLTNTYLTSKQDGYTALLIADTLEPGNKYDYRLYINYELVNLSYATTFQTQPLWKWRTILTSVLPWVAEPTSTKLNMTVQEKDTVMAIRFLTALFRNTLIL